MMDTSNEINVYNLNDFVTYERPPERNILKITWVHSNVELTNLMIRENSIIGRKDCYTNSLWVNEMKNILMWEEGKSFNVIIYRRFQDNNKLIIKESGALQPTSRFAYLKIDENGYLMIKPPLVETFDRCNCLYNDLWDEERGPCILK